jgi:hypothetical protein
MKNTFGSLLSLSCAALSLGALTACTEVESEDVMTDGMYANFVARVIDSGTRIEANLNVGGSGSNATNVELTGDDTLEATIDGDTKALDKVQEIIDINDPHYTAKFDGVVAAGTEVTVAFKRTVDDGAPSSTVTLASEPNASGPTGEQSRAEAELVVSFAAGGDDESTTITISGECFQSSTQSVDGDNATQVTFAPGALKEPEPKEDEEPAAPATCDATITISRARTGTIDPAFGEGGLFRSLRDESLSFSSAP